MIPTHTAPTVVGFSYETIQYLLGGSIRGSYYTLNDNIINGRIRGVAGVVGCNNCRTTHDSSHLTLIKELIKNDVIVLSTGCSAMAAGKDGLLTPGSGQVTAARVWPRSARPWVSRRSCTWAPASTTPAS